VLYTGDGKELLIWFKNVTPFTVVGDKHLQAPFLFKIGERIVESVPQSDENPRLAAI